MAPASVTRTHSVAVLADVHRNSPPFRAVIDDVIAQGCSKCHVLGDIINGVDPLVFSR